jgi:hypothetical protein
MQRLPRLSNLGDRFAEGGASGGAGVAGHRAVPAAIRFTLPQLYHQGLNPKVCWRGLAGLEIAQFSIRLSSSKQNDFNPKPTYLMVM